jgi:hypothetical protein
VGDENLKVYITEYYKKLFGAPAHSSVTMNEDRIDDIPQLFVEENVLLSKKIIEEEVFEAISQMKHNKAPGHDGFPGEFYQQFWDVIKGDLMAMFCHFQNGGFPLFKLNFGIITLLP